MISSDHQILLNSSTATVSSFSSLFSCLFSSSSISSSPTTRQNKHNRKTSSSFSSSVVASSLISSFSLLFAAAILSYLMCQELAAAETSTSPPKYWISWKYGPDNRNKLESNNSSFAKNIFPDDMTQNDEPPRDFSESGVPKSWIQQPQVRFYYLQADNDQYLQLYDGKVTGTKEPKPPFGIVRFLSHKENLVIRGFIEHKYLCMNEASEVYLSDKEDDPECYLEETSLQTNGSYATAYYFSKYKTGKKRYLGINCDPMLGTKTDHHLDSSRFTRLDILEKDAEGVRETVNKLGREKFVKKKCVSSADKKTREKAKRQKLRWRWCLNIDRMIQNRLGYMHNCTRKKSHKNCDRSDKENNSKRCVCNILKNMLSKPKRARRKCLIEKLTKWIQRKNGEPKSKALIEASKLLVRNYAPIARRIRLLKARKKKKRQRQYKKSQLEKKAHIDTDQATYVSINKHPTQTLEQNHHHRQHQESKNRRRRKRRRRIIKLNAILKKYGNELIISSPGVHLNEQPITTERTISLSHVTHSSIFRKNNEPSVLSDEFKRVLNSLSSEPHRRRRHRGHRRKRRKPRHTNLKSENLESKNKNSFVDSVSSIKSSAVSPG